MKSVNGMCWLVGAALALFGCAASGQDQGAGNDAEDEIVATQSALAPGCPSVVLSSWSVDMTDLANSEKHITRLDAKIANSSTGSCSYVWVEWDIYAGYTGDLMTWTYLETSLSAKKTRATWWNDPYDSRNYSNKSYGNDSRYPYVRMWINDKFYDIGYINSTRTNVPAGNPSTPPSWL